MELARATLTRQDESASTWNGPPLGRSSLDVGNSSTFSPSVNSRVAPTWHLGLSVGSDQQQRCFYLAQGSRLIDYASYNGVCNRLRITLLYQPLGMAASRLGKRLQVMMLTKIMALEGLHCSGQLYRDGGTLAGFGRDLHFATMKADNLRHDA